jgi:hypothetical protein
MEEYSEVEAKMGTKMIEEAIAGRAGLEGVGW